MKLKIYRILIMLMLSMIFSTSSLAATKNIEVIVDGVELYTDVPPKIINDRTLVPMRAIFEAIGAKVEWKDSTKTVIGTKGNDKIVLQIGSKKATVNGETYTLDSPAVIVNNRTLVPIRFIAESLGAEVYWDNINRRVIISTYEDTSNNNGYVVYRWAHGEIYEGYWVNGVRQGYGKNTWPHGEIYEGEWMNDVRQGYGTNRWPDGETYEGNWMNDVRYGYGTNRWPNGEVQEGYWVNDNFMD